MTPRLQPAKIRFTVAEFYQMIESGILKDYEHAEIIDGELIKKMSVGDLHAAIVNLLNRFFSKNVSDDVLISVQNPIYLNEYHEPEPDLVLADLTKYDGRRHPRPAEILLIVEVADTSLDYDRSVKLPLYAAAAIPEVWLINLQNKTVEQHTRLHDGIYSLIRILRGAEVLECESVPNLRIEIAKVLN